MVVKLARPVAFLPRMEANPWQRIPGSRRGIPSVCTYVHSYLQRARSARTGVRCCSDVKGWSSRAWPRSVATNPFAWLSLFRVDQLRGGYIPVQLCVSLWMYIQGWPTFPLQVADISTWICMEVGFALMFMFYDPRVVCAHPSKCRGG